jgi:glyoxylase-like metal-dependent hydrolase (beta-lactamase superfamily II)
MPSAAFTVDADLAVQSIRRLAALDFDVLCPGHGPAIVGSAADQVRAMADGL